jgi:hypothetical protein
MWAGAWDVAEPPRLPEGLRPFLDARRLLVMVVRYLEGSTLRYDELIFASLARRGPRVGLFVHHIWVDSEASLWGGRRIWGLNKELATFVWEEDTVTVSDAAGVIAAVRVDRRPASGPRWPMLGPGFGVLDGRLIFTLATGRGKIRRAEMQVEAWSPRFPYQVSGPASFGFAANPLRMSVPAAAALD